MHIKAVASAIALSSAMLLSSGAFAQTTVGSFSVSDEELPRVQVHCDDLAVPEAATLNVEPNEDGEVNTGIDSTTDNAGYTGTINLDEITLEMCVEAGLVERP